MTVLPGAIRQIGYIVTDLDTALESWVELGVGPWFVMRDMPVRGFYRGEPCEVTLSIGLANSGEMQFEVIQQMDDTPSVYTEFLSASGPGYHQLAYWTEDFDATMASVHDAGWPVVWLGDPDAATQFAYVESPNSPATIIEIMELNELMVGMGKFVRDAAETWDGSDPIRVVTG